MFSFRKSVVAAVAVGMIFTFGACKRSGGAGVTAQGLTSSWNIDDVNSLLAYVPEDAPIVIASTRNFSIDSPAVKTLLERSINVYEKGFEAIGKTAGDTDKKALDAMKGSFASVFALIKNYAAESANWGLQANGHQDSVFYVSGDSVVGHSTVVDGDKFKVKMNELLSGLTVAGETKAFKVKEIGSGDNAWTLFQPDTVADVNSPLPSFAFHYGKNLVTFTIVNGEPDVNTLAALTKPVAKAISKDALGKIGNDDMTVGFVDGVKLIDLLKVPSVAVLYQAAGVDISDVCVTDFKALTSNFPKVKLSARILNDGVLEENATLVFADKADLKKLQNLHSQTVSLKSANTLANIALNVQLDKAIPFLSDLGKAMDAKKYKCEALQRMTAQTLSFQEMAADPDVTKYASAVSSINVVLDAFDFNAKKADASLVISGDKLGELMPEISQMLAALNVPLTLTKDQVSNFDLTSLIQWPVVVDMTYSDKDLAIATSGHDVKAMTKLSKAASKNFFEIGISYSLFSIVSPDLGDAFKSVAYGVAIGTDDEGLRFTITAKL